MKFSRERLIESRKVAGLTQGQLAEKLGVIYQMVQKWEYGRSAPSGDNLKALGAVLNKPTDFFFSSTDQTRPANADASSIPRMAPMAPSKAKHVRQSRQHLRQAMETMAKAQEQLFETQEPEKLAVALRAMAKVQRSVLAAQDELDRLMEG